MTRKSVLRSVRLDDDVWDAVKAMDQSLNQYLRDHLLSGLDRDLKEFDQRRDQVRERMARGARAFKGPIPRPKDKRQ